MAAMKKLPILLLDFDNNGIIYMTFFRPFSYFPSFISVARRFYIITICNVIFYFEYTISYHNTTIQQYSSISETLVMKSLPLLHFVFII
jgi:hypothetical protein